jgi:hypothetical protein
MSSPSCCWFRTAVSVALAATFVALPVATAFAQSDDYYERDEIPGHYSVGIYADKFGKSRELEVPSGEQVFDCFIGITGDSTKVFSALVFRLEFPLGASLDRPITWAPVPGLKQTDSLLGKGAKVEFNKECIVQNGTAPAIVGRMRVRVAADLEEFEIQPLAHRKFGLSVELCDDARVWPKPFAEALPLKITRKRGFLQRVHSLFGG